MASAFEKTTSSHLSAERLCFHSPSVSGGGCSPFLLLPLRLSPAGWAIRCGRNNNINGEFKGEMNSRDLQRIRQIAHKGMQIVASEFWVEGLKASNGCSLSWNSMWLVTTCGLRPVVLFALGASEVPLGFWLRDFYSSFYLLSISWFLKLKVLWLVWSWGPDG